MKLRLTLAFLAAFLVLRALAGRDRARVALALVAVGAVSPGESVSPRDIESPPDRPGDLDPRPPIS